MLTEDNELAALRQAVLADPRNGELRYLLGAEMAQQRDYEGAVLEMSAAIALSPFLHVARFQLGLLHLTMAQPHHALAVLAPLEELDDSSALKYFKRGLEALIADDFPNTTRWLEQGIALNKDNEALNRDMALIIGRATEAMSATQQQPSTQPPNADAAASATDDAVRTDFSLYGLTKH